MAESRSLALVYNQGNVSSDVEYEWILVDNRDSSTFCGGEKKEEARTLD